MRIGFSPYIFAELALALIRFVLSNTDDREGKLVSTKNLTSQSATQIFDFKIEIQFQKRQ